MRKMSDAAGSMRRRALARWCCRIAPACLLWAVANRCVHAEDKPTTEAALPADIRAILEKPLYKNAVWGLRVVDADTGEVIYDLDAKRKLLIGSVRKLISIGMALDKLGADHRFATPVYRTGAVESGILEGDLI